MYGPFSAKIRGGGLAKDRRLLFVSNINTVKSAVNLAVKN